MYFNIYWKILDIFDIFSSLGLFYGPRFLKNVLDSDLQTFGFLSKDFYIRNIVKNWIYPQEMLWIYWLDNISFNLALKEVFF